MKYPSNIRSNCQLKSVTACAVLNHPRNVENSRNLDSDSAGRYGARRYEIEVVATGVDMLVAAMAQYPPPKYTSTIATIEAIIFPRNSAINTCRKLICRM